MPMVRLRLREFLTKTIKASDKTEEVLTFQRNDIQNVNSELGLNWIKEKSNSYYLLEAEREIFEF